MVDCGCKPCSKPIPKQIKSCKPFSLCVGNYVFYWDGSCASIQHRKYQIPDGTYTSITFEDGCITNVGEAPLPQYTPQACCDVEVNTQPTQGGTSVTRGNNPNNLVSITHGAISVEPQWSAQGSVKVTGNGSADKPWTASVKISNAAGNALVVNTDGLFASLSFKTSDTVTVSGDGSKLRPYKFDVKGAEATLPKFGEPAEGPGYEIDEFGRIKVDEGLKFVANLEFDNDAFSVQSVGPSTKVLVNLEKLKGATKVADDSLITGNGSNESPLNINEESLMEKVIAKLTELGYQPSGG